MTHERFLSVSTAAAALNARGNALPECTLGKATVLYERDEHGRVYMLVGASSNVGGRVQQRCWTPPTTLAGPRGTPGLTRICDDTASQSLE